MTAIIGPDWTQNAALTPATRTRAPDDTVFPTEPFGRYAWTIWVRPSVGLKGEFLEGLVQGKLLHLRGLDIVKGLQGLGLRGDIDRKAGEGARVSVTMMSDSDQRAKKILR